ncbi:MAG: cytochrome c oxidase subunit 3 [Planctomycetota bacterium]|nr:cytochrome c oxidase subunit 3 [Planctomycetota bacterium]
MSEPRSAADQEARLTRGKVGMACLIVIESCFFATFIVAYLFFIGKSAVGPQPREVLDIAPVLVNSVALLSSSVTAVFAFKALARGSMVAFQGWMASTIALGAYFILGTGREWMKLIYSDGLTISTNLFGTTFFSLVGFHAFHVCIGLALLALVLILSLRGHVKSSDAGRVELLGWYWHFVDAVWIVVFTVVYVVGMEGTSP